MSAEPDADSQGLPVDTLGDIASTFVRARISANGMAVYPGAAPANLATAYQIQDLAIDLWEDSIGGWKVGRIPPAMENEFGCDRLAGPIFTSTIVRQNGQDGCEMPVYAEGFAAVEAEYVAVISQDAPPDKIHWKRSEAKSMISELRIGLEIASSPLRAINDCGPAVTASDFGNNAGLIIGSAIADWNERELRSLAAATFIDGALVGEGGAFLLTGGVERSVQFMLELAASRKRPLRAGEYIATGQTTGIHEVSIGQNVRVLFADGADGELTCRVIAASTG